MSYETFKNTVLCNLSKDNSTHGYWKGEKRAHVLDITSDAKKVGNINKYMLLTGVAKIDEEQIHLHQYAHHLNSSQIMCYNFFRPLLGEYADGWFSPTDKLLATVGQIIRKPLSLSEPCRARFEHIEGKERTNFDFYLECGEVKIYFEIKYTEQYFSKTTSASNPIDNYAIHYKNAMPGFIFSKSINEEDFNQKYYQLGRNSIKAIDDNHFVIFVCPKCHPYLNKQYKEFQDRYLKADQQQVKLVYWETLVDAAKEQGVETDLFFNRYLSFLKDIEK